MFPSHSFLRVRHLQELRIFANYRFRYTFVTVANTLGTRKHIVISIPFQIGLTIDAVSIWLPRIIWRNEFVVDRNLYTWSHTRSLAPEIAPSSSFFLSVFAFQDRLSISADWLQIPRFLTERIERKPTNDQKEVEYSSLLPLFKLEIDWSNIVDGSISERSETILISALTTQQREGVPVKVYDYPIALILLMSLSFPATVFPCAVSFYSAESSFPIQGGTIVAWSSHVLVVIGL